MNENFRLREMKDSDIPVFSQQQLDPEATQMAGVPIRGKDEFHSHWRRSRSDQTKVLHPTLFEGNMAGNIPSWKQNGKRQTGYWIGKDYWSIDIPSQALAQSLIVIKARPRLGVAANHKAASIRVLKNIGFHSSTMMWINWFSKQ